MPIQTIPFRQPSFIGGEIAEGLWARTDLKRYSASMRLLRNMIVLQEGPAINRGGWLYKGATKTATGHHRLIPFIFSSGTLSNNYVLEVGEYYIRIWKNGVRMESPPGTPVEIITPYTSDEVPRLKFTQYGQVMTIACKQRPMKEITWLGDTSWQIADFTVQRAITAPTGLYIDIAPAGDLTVIAKVWQVVVTAVKAGTNEESLPSAFAQATMAIATNKPARYAWTAVAGASEYNVYRGRNGKFGYVGTAIGTAVFNDDGAYPVYAEVPPSARDPISTTVDYQPQVVTYHDERLVTANPWNDPAKIEMSRIAEYKNFDRAAPPKESDAVTIRVTSHEYEEIRSILSVDQHMLVLSSAREWKIGAEGGLIHQRDFLFDRHSKWGSSWLDPLLIGDAVIFNQDVGSTVREMIPADKQAGNDLTLLAQHLFRGYSITSWCYAHEPFRTIWAVRSDGTMLCCTYVRAHETWAWTRHDSGGASAEWVCSVPEGTEHAVYALMKRTVNGSAVKYIERLAPRVNQTYAAGVFLDCAIIYSGVAATVIGGLSHLIGATVYALADGVVRGPFVVSGAGTITLPVAASLVNVGLRVTAQGSTLDMYSSQEEIRTAKKLVTGVFAEVTGSAAFRVGQRLTDTLELATTPDGQDWPATGYSGLAKINNNADWDDSGQISWEHVDPTPIMIKSIIREVQLGDS